MIHQNSNKKLLDKLNEAQTKIKRESFYKHYRTNELYYIRDFGLIEVNEEVAVIYSPVDCMEVVWIRPLHEFIESVDYNGTTVCRFQLYEK